MACQRGTSGKWVGSNGGLEVVGATLRGELGVGAEGEREAEMEVEAEGETGGVPLTQMSNGFCDDTDCPFTDWVGRNTIVILEFMSRHP